MQAELERLRAENAQLKSKDRGGLTLKVSEKGGVSLYGMGRFPNKLQQELCPGFMCNSPGFQCGDNAVKSRKKIENKQA
jgi:hypothetical protein